MSMFNYESDEIAKICQGAHSSDTLYVADCKQTIIQGVKGSYPQLCEYEKEWLDYGKTHYEGGNPSNLEYQSVIVNPQATVKNAIPFHYKSAILKGNTGYRDIDTGEILETFEEGRNLELVSVKMPVLTTTGKNVFNPNWLINEDTKHAVSIVDGNAILNGEFTRSITWFEFKLPKGTYKATNFNTSDKSIHVFWRGTDAGFTHDKPFTYDAETTVKGYIVKGVYVNHVLKLQVESGTEQSTYEPYKSNILTVNEDVKLRGIGDVQDTLDCLTRKVTERIREVTLNGSEEWSVNNSNNEGFFSCSTTTFVGMPNGKVICDKLPSATSTKSEGVMMGITTGKVMVSFDRDKTGVTSLATFKEKLAQLQLKVCYELATESIKTVDLSHQIKPYEETNHYEVSSDTISPIGEISVPVVSTGTKTLNDILTSE